MLTRITFSCADCGIKDASFTADFEGGMPLSVPCPVCKKGTEFIDEPC